MNLMHSLRCLPGVRPTDVLFGHLKGAQHLRDERKQESHVEDAIEDGERRHGDGRRRKRRRARRKDGQSIAETLKTRSRFG